MTLDLAAAARAVAEGTLAYGRGDFDAAVRSFESAVAAGADSADVWYDLGNACYRAGQQGRAALAWERALRRDPGDEDARANLSLVRAASPDVAIVGEDPVLARLGARLAPDPLAAGLLGTWLLACALLLARRLAVGRSARLVLGLGAALLVAASAVLGAATILAVRARDAGDAVVLVSSTPVRDAPEDAARTAFELHEGTRVRLTGRTGPFAHIRLPSGLTGFVEARHLETVALQR